MKKNSESFWRFKLAFNPPVYRGTQTQQGLFLTGPPGLWGRSRCGTDTSSLESKFCAPPEGIQHCHLANNYIVSLIMCYAIISTVTE